MNIEKASLYANQITKQIEVFNRGGNRYFRMSFYEYYNNTFTLVAYEYHFHRRDNNDQDYIEITRTNVISGAAG